MSFKGSLDPSVAALHPNFNHLPRLASLELSEPAAGARAGTSSCGRVHGWRRDLSGDANVMVHFSAAPDPSSVDLLSHLWDPSLSESAALRVVLPALPHALVPAAKRCLLEKGRAVTFMEPCRTWVPAPGSAAASAGAAAAAAAAAAAKVLAPQGFAAGSLRPEEAPLVDRAWKYRREGASLAMVCECIQSRPALCVRRLADGAPVCWAVLRADGSWGLLHTVPDARRRGLARALMLHAFAAQWAWCGMRADEPLAALVAPYVHIALGNAESEGLFTALGFVPSEPVTWVMSTALSPTWAPLRLLRAGEEDALLAHVNASYKQDDAFFVEQDRTTKESLAAMAAEGAFLLGWGDDGALRVSVYVKTIPAPATAGAEGGEGWAAAPGAPLLPPASPFAADARQGGGGGDAPPGAAGAAAGAKPSGAAPQLLAPPFPGRVCSISLLTVAPRLKRQGAARRVVEEVLTRARAEGCAAAEVFIVSVKPWLLRFWEGVGFRVVGAEPWPAFLEHQLRSDCFFWQARLELGEHEGP
jgi:GNAT superfamily N-acetyltransferase